MKTKLAYIVELVLAVILVGPNSYAVVIWIWWVFLTWLCIKIIRRFW